jgi:hypothetical protein
MASYPLTPNPNFMWGGSNGGIRDLPREAILGPMVNYADVTSQIDATGETPLTQGPTRGLFVDQAGTLTGHDAYGNVITTIHLQAGYNPICVGGITSVVTITQIIGCW